MNLFDDLHGADRHDDGDDHDDPEEFDDPVVAAVDHEVGAVLRSTDVRMLACLAVALVALFLPRWMHVRRHTHRLLDAFAVLCIAGGIAYAVVTIVRAKRRIDARHGLTCGRCGYAPVRTARVLAAAELRHCARCGGELAVH